MWVGDVPTEDIAAHFSVPISTIYTLQRKYQLPSRGRICKPKISDPTPDEIEQRAAECRARRAEAVEHHARVEIRQYVRDDSTGRFYGQQFAW